MSKPMTEQQKALKELMEKYTEWREEWVAQFGSKKGFDAWFTKQVLGN